MIGYPVHLLFQLPVGSAAGANPDSGSLGTRQVGNGGAVLQERVQIADHLVAQGALPDSGRHQISGPPELLVGQQFRQFGKHLFLHQVFHFVRHARKDRQGRSGLGIPEPHARRRALLVEQHFAVFQNLCLVVIGPGEGNISFFEYLLDEFQYRIVDHQSGIEQLLQRFFGDVVVGRSQAAGRHYQVGPIKAFP